MTTYIEKTNNIIFYVAEFSANELNTKRRFNDKFWDAFNIVYTKEYNLDLLDECMRDLSWIEQRAFKIIITNYYSYLNKGWNFDFLIEALNLYEEYWKENKCEFIVELR